MVTDLGLSRHDRDDFGCLFSALVSIISSDRWLAFELLCTLLHLRRHDSSSKPPQLALFPCSDTIR